MYLLLRTWEHATLRPLTAGRLLSMVGLCRTLSRSSSLDRGGWMTLFQTFLGLAFQNKFLARKEGTSVGGAPKKRAVGTSIVLETGICIREFTVKHEEGGHSLSMSVCVH